MGLSIGRQVSKKMRTISTLIAVFAVVIQPLYSVVDSQTASASPASAANELKASPVSSTVEAGVGTLVSAKAIWNFGFGWDNIQATRNTTTVSASVNPGEGELATDCSSTTWSSSVTKSVALLSNVDKSFCYRGTVVGAHTVNFSASLPTYASAGTINLATSAVVTVVDTTKPTVPSAISPVGLNQPPAQFTWSPSVEVTGTTTYEAIMANHPSTDVNGKLTSAVVTIANGTSATSAPVPSPLQDGPFFWQIRAKDASGNYSAWSNPAGVTIDGTGPSAPTALSPTGTNKTASAFTWSASTDLGGSNPITYEIITGSSIHGVDGTGKLTNGVNAIASGISGTSYNYAFTDGTFYWQVRASDGLGNKSAWSNIQAVTLDSTPPVGTISYSTTNPTNGGVTVTLETNEPIKQSSLTGTWLKKSDTKYQKVYNTNTVQNNTLEDNLGNISTAIVSINWIDKSKPTTPLALSPNGFSDSNDITFSWIGSIDTNVASYQGVNAVSYELITGNHPNLGTDGKMTSGVVEHQNGIIGSSYTINDLAEGPYFWQVRAKDAAGNYSAWSNPGVLQIDTQAPIIDGLSLSKTTANENDNFISVSGTISDPYLKEYKYQVVNSQKQNTLGEYSWSKVGGTSSVNNGTLFNVNLSTLKLDGATVASLPDGDYFVRVWAVDYLGHSTGINNPKYYLPFTIDKTAPGQPEVTYSNNSQLTQDNVTVTISFNEKVTIDNSLWSVVDSSDGKIWKSTAFTSNTDGTVDAKDVAGNGVEVSYSVVGIDKDAPSINISGTVFGETNVYTSSVEYNITDNNTGITVTGAPTSSLEGTISEDGTYTLVAKDTVGNKTEKTFIIDTKGPGLVVTSLVKNDDGSYTLSGTTSEESDNVVVSVDGGAPQPTVRTGFGWSLTVPSLSLSNHTFIVSGIDQYENLSSKTFSRDLTVAAVSAGNPINGTSPGVLSTVSGVSPRTLLATTSQSNTQDVDSTTAGENGQVLGTQDNESTDKVAAISPSEQGWKIFGIAWYWWLLILAAIAAIWWAIAGYRRRNSEQV